MTHLYCVFLKVFGQQRRYNAPNVRFTRFRLHKQYLLVGSINCCFWSFHGICRIMKKMLNVTLSFNASVLVSVGGFIQILVH